MRRPFAAISAPLLALSLGVLLPAPTAVAQDDGMDDLLGDDDEDGDTFGDESRAAPIEPASDEPTDEEPARDDAEPGEAAAAQAPSDDSDTQTLYVIQGKPTLVGGRFEFSPQIAQTVNDRFISQTGLILSGIYHFRENMALQLNAGAFMWFDNAPVMDVAPRGFRLGGRFTDTTTELNDREFLRPEAVKFFWQTWVLTADLQWSPIYGKVSIHDVVLGQFNVYLSVGAGVTGIEHGRYLEYPGPLSDPDSIPDHNLTTTGDVTGLPPMALTTTIGGGIRFYFLDWLGVRFEVRDYVQALATYSQYTPDDEISSFEVRNTLLIQAGVSFLF